jgi:hypothetical protein
VASVRHSLTAREAAKPLELLMRRDFLQRAFPELKDRAKLMPTLRVEPLPYLFQQSRHKCQALGVNK